MTLDGSAPLPVAGSAGRRIARLEAEMALAATAPPLLLRGDAIEVLPDAFAHVPAGTLPVVTTTWALSRFPLESRLRFLNRLDEAATGRTVAWVSVKEVEDGQAIPTFGDRRASGHSIIGVALFESSRLCAPRPLAAAGRGAACWRGLQAPSSAPLWIQPGRLMSGTSGTWPAGPYLRVVVRCLSAAVVLAMLAGPPGPALPWRRQLSRPPRGRRACRRCPLPSQPPPPRRPNPPRWPSSARQRPG